MTSLGLLAALMNLDQSSAVLERSIASIESANQGHIEFQFEFGETKFPGSLRWKRPDRQLYRMTGPGYELEIRQEAKTSLELQHGDKFWQLVSVRNGLGHPEFESAEELYDLYPPFLIVNSLRSFSTKKLLKSVGSGAAKIDTLELLQESEAGSERVELQVAHDGTIRLLSRTVTLGGGQRVFTWRISKFEVGEKAAFPSLVMTPPADYMPFALPDDAEVLQPGEKLPAAGWSALSALGSAESPLAASAPFVLFLSDTDCPVSRAAREVLPKLANVLAAKKCGISELCLSKKPPVQAEHPVYCDRAGELTRALGAQGTPAFFLVDRKGVLVQAWLGYSVEEADSLLRSIAEAIDYMAQSEP